MITYNRRDQQIVFRDVFRVEKDKLNSMEKDFMAVEEPLEICIAGESIAITMRTPGEDSRLAIGFLFSEGIVASIDDVGRAFHCGRPGDEGYGNMIEILPGPGTSLDIDLLKNSRRGTLTTSACGICGRQSIEDLLDRCQPLPKGQEFHIDKIGEVIHRLRKIQPIFDETGGVHASAAFTISGELLACFEDVGRHNAVDKTVGSLLFDRLVGIGKKRDRAPAILAVSGRASFEIVQKAAMARIPIVASVSAPSSLAVDLSISLGITLAGFVRGKRFNIYSHPERIIDNLHGLTSEKQVK